MEQWLVDQYVVQGMGSLSGLISKRISVFTVLPWQVLVHRKLWLISAYYVSGGVCRKRTCLSEGDVTVNRTDRWFLCRKAFSRLPFLRVRYQPRVPIEASGSMTDLSMRPHSMAHFILFYLFIFIYLFILFFLLMKKQQHTHIKVQMTKIYIPVSSL